MNLISAMLASAPRYVVILLVVVMLVFGSHAGLDYLVAFLGDACVPVDATTSVCLVADTAQ